MAEEVIEVEYLPTPARPLLVKLLDNRQQEVSFLVKHQKLHSDICCLAVMKLMNQCCSRLHCVVYRVEIIQGASFVEFVPDCLPLSHFTNVLPHYWNGISLAQFVSNKNQFLASYVGVFLSGYLLELADRQDNNFLVTKDGCLFHIDLDYSFGAFPPHESKLNALFSIPFATLSWDILATIQYPSETWQEALTRLKKEIAACWLILKSDEEFVGAVVGCGVKPTKFLLPEDRMADLVDYMFGNLYNRARSFCHQFLV